MALQKGREIPTIDCVLVTISVGEGDKEIALETASQIQVEVQAETVEAKKLIVKGKLISQKRQDTTITGNTITLTDNVFNPELVLTLQGGEIDVDSTTGVIKGYKAPVAGSTNKGEVFTLNAYSASYNAAGIVECYERIKYPNCQGRPVALSSQDDTFRAPQYVIDSMPEKGQAPYEITYLDSLPLVAEYTPTPNP